MVSRARKPIIGTRMQDSKRNGRQDTGDGVRFEMENIGGIEATTAEIEPGVTVLAGKNATNRTSFLQAIMAVYGSNNASLKADADKGRVEMTLGDQTYERRLYRRNGTVAFDGNPYLEDPMLADLFAFLLESNEARQSIARSEDLREIIMRPVDTEEIKCEIRALESDREEVDRELEQLDSLSDRLPDLEEERQQLQEDIQETRASLETREAEFDDLDGKVEETRAEKEAYEEKIEELGDVRNGLRELEQQIVSERRSIESLESEYGEWESKIDDLEEVPEDRVTHISQELQRLRGQVQEMKSSVAEIQSVIQFNRDFLDDGRPEVVEDMQLDGSGSAGDVTGKLLDDTEGVVCWTCGSEVETEQIESTLDQFQSFCDEKISDRQALESRIDELKDEKSTLEARQREHENATQKLDDVEAEIQERETRLEDLIDRKESLEAEAEELEDEIEDLEAEEQSEILETHKEINRLQFELDQRESDLEDTESRIEEIESKLERRDALEREHDDISEEITDLRTRVDDLQEQAIEEFNSHMDAVLEQLDYERIERIWIERAQEEVREGRRKVTRSQFRLHIVRSTDAGAVYEDIVDHLSESERKVTGLVFALAGYLVHEVYDHVPFMLLDSIEAIDSDRIARLVEYLSDYADFLVVALLEEDAQALGDDYARIESV